MTFEDAQALDALWHEVLGPGSFCPAFGGGMVTVPADDLRKLLSVVYNAQHLQDSVDHGGSYSFWLTGALANALLRLRGEVPCPDNAPALGATHGQPS